MLPTVVAGVSKIDVPPMRSSKRLQSGIGVISANDRRTLYLGPENRLVEATIARIVGQGFADEGPFVFWGVSGSGKSLIGRSIIDYHTRRALKSPALITTASDWVRHVDDAGEGTDRAPWLTMVDRISLFVIEDLESLAGHLQAQYELALMLDGLAASEIPVVVTCKRAPIHFHELDPRLISRLMAGTLVQVRLPSEATITAFVSDINVRPEVREALDQHFGSSTSLQEIHSLVQRLNHGDDQESVHFTTEDVIRVCARYFRFSVKQVKGPSRRRGLAFARSVTVFLLRDLTHKSFKEVGHLLGGRDHSTVLHAFKKIDQEIKQDPDLYALIKDLRSAIHSQALAR